MAFDWASQPFNTLGLTFIFGPYFAAVATTYFMGAGPTDAAAVSVAVAGFVATNFFIGTGVTEEAADAQAQVLWSNAQMWAGLFIAFTAPVLGAIADSSGRKIPWIAFFSVIFVIGSWSIWWLMPDATNLYLVLAVFFIGFIAAESALNFVNAILPSLGTKEEIGRISGSGAAFGYWGGVLGLFIILIFFAEGETGKTFVGLDPVFGLDPDIREGTRSVGPFIAIWYVIFIIPFFLYVRDDPVPHGAKLSLSASLATLKTTFKSLGPRKSLRNLLIASMFYRDALNALYIYGGVYATLVLDWEITQVGVFGIVSAITAAIATWASGRVDEKHGPMPVIYTSICLLLVVVSIIIGMSREQVFGVPLAEGSLIPDIIFYVCGSIIGGAGGALYTSSRSLMVRHTDLDRPTESFGLFALSGKATAFLAPALIGLMTSITGNTQLGFTPLLFLFAIGLFMLRWVNKNGDQIQ